MTADAQQTASGKTAKKKNSENERAAGEESVDHAAAVLRARKNVVLYAKALKK